MLQTTNPNNNEVSMDVSSYQFSEEEVIRLEQAGRPFPQSRWYLPNSIWLLRSARF